MSGRYFLGLATLIAVVSIGCGGGGGRSTNLKVAAGQLAVSPASLNFGKVPVGKTESKTGTLTAGDSSIRVTSAAWTGEGFSVSGIVFPVIVPAGQSVSFRVTFAPPKAGNSAGNISFVSDASNSPHAASFRGNGTAQSGTHAVTLSWRANTSAVAGYNVYRGAAPKGPYTKINSALNSTATYTDASVQPGQTYFYMTTAVDKKGRESKFSNQVQVTLPNS
jgi:hypothetical protein